MLSFPEASSELYPLCDNARFGKGNTLFMFLELLLRGLFSVLRLDECSLTQPFVLCSSLQARATYIKEYEGTT